MIHDGQIVLFRFHQTNQSTGKLRPESFGRHWYSASSPDTIMTG